MLTSRSNGWGNDYRKAKLKRQITGWVNYFKIAGMKTLLHNIDEWMRRRIRALIWKQWKKNKTKYRNLRKLGVRHPKSLREQENERIAEQVKKIHEAHPDMGYRRIQDELDRRHDIHVNDKRILRINRALHIQSTIKFRRHGCTRSAASPEYVAKNYLGRQFHAEAPNRKWLTDVTELKYYVGPEVHKLYLSAILNLCDRRIVSFVISDRNDNRLVFDTLNAAVAAEPKAHPLFHSDRGFQYTSAVFHQKLRAAGMKQSMSRVAHCIDNGPMEGFWGILKRERYYGYRFTDRTQLMQMITDYIYFYNYHRLQRRLLIMTPMEFHQHFALAA